MPYQARITPNQLTFISEYIESGNAVQSYLTAYGCKLNSARAAAYPLLDRPHVAAEIDRIRKKSESVTAISAGRLLQEETRLSTSTLSDIVDKDGDIIPLHLLTEDIQRALSGVDITDIIKSVKDLEDGITETILERKYKYRLWDKGKSIERGERHLGMFEKDNQQHSQAPVININYGGREGAEHQRIYELVMDNLYLLPAEFQKLIAPGIPQDKTPNLPDPIPPTEQIPQDIG